MNILYTRVYLFLLKKNMSEAEAIVRIDNLTRGYPGQRMIFQEFDFSVLKGEFSFIVGSSGSGKTSLMKLATGEITPPTEMVFLQNYDMWHMKGEKLQALRRRIGVVYQDYKLLLDRSAFENIALPLQLQNQTEQDIKNQVMDIAKEFWFEDKIKNKVSLLSWGEKQKVAIMRALITKPTCVFADEPTGNLDRESTKMIADMLIQANQKWQTIVFITHDRNLITYVQEKLAGVKITRVS